jgi:predicted ATP-dependent Lon-type protease
MRVLPPVGTSVNSTQEQQVQRCCALKDVLFGWLIMKMSDKYFEKRISMTLLLKFNEKTRNQVCEKLKKVYGEEVMSGAFAS